MYGDRKQVNDPLGLWRKMRILGGISKEYEISSWGDEMFLNN